MQLIRLVSVVVVAGSLGMLAAQNFALKQQLSRRSSEQGLSEGDVIATLALVNLRGLPRTLKDVAPGVAVVYFFNTTCAYCERSAGVLPSLQSRLAHLGVEVVAVSLDDPSATRDYLDGLGISLVAFSVSEAADAVWMGVSRVPAFVLVEGGTVRRSWLGELTEARVAEIADSVHP